jgi:nitrous oxidase accessory protein NosD
MRAYPAVLALVICCAFGSARAEVTDCTEVTSLPAVINSPGIWCLKSDLSSNRKTGSLIRIGVSGVTLDLNGHTLNGVPAGPTTQAVGIRANDVVGAIIRNGIIRGFATGVLLDGAASANHLLENLQVDRSSIYGMDVKGTGIIVRNNQITDVGGGGGEFQSAVGIYAHQTNRLTITGNVIAHLHGNNMEGYGVFVSGGDTVEVSGNSITDPVTGIYFENGQNAVIDRNRLIFGAASINVVGSSAVTCTNNVAAGFVNGISGCNTTVGNVP